MLQSLDQQISLVVNATSFGICAKLSFGWVTKDKRNSQPWVGVHGFTAAHGKK